MTVFREGEAEPSLPIEEPVQKVEEKKPVEVEPPEVAETGEGAPAADA